MAISTEKIAETFYDVAADDELNNNYPLYADDEVEVIYGPKGSLTAILNTDYEVELSGPNYDTFKIIVLQSLVDKIDDVIEDDAEQINYVTVRRKLDNKTSVTQENVRYVGFLSREIERITMRFQQLAERVGRAVSLAPNFIASADFDPIYVEPKDGHALVWDGNLGQMRNTNAPLTALEGDAQTVADNIDAVISVAADLDGPDNIGSVVANFTNINTVAGISAAVTTVAGIASAVSTVSGIAAAVSSVSGNATNINTVATNIANVNTVAFISAAVTTVAGNATNINTVATNIANVNTVAFISAAVTTVAGINAAVSTVAGISANVTSVAGNATNINAVAANATNINTVAANMADIQTVAANITDIQDAEENAGIAEEARDDALAAQAAAEAARDATLAAFDSFDDRYLGAKTSDPSVDNDGNALVAGTLYYNSVDAAMKIYTGSIWVAAYVSGTDFCARANNLSDVASASAARTNLGLAIGTNVQAYNAVLQSIAGLGGTLVQGDLIYGSGANAVSRLAKDTNVQRVLTNGGTNNNPAWGQVSLTQGVTGDLPLSNLAQGTARSVLGVTGNATADYAPIQGAANQVLVINSAGTGMAFGQVNLASSAAVTGVLAMANGGLGVALTDPNADRILFWDDSAGQYTWLQLVGATINGTTLTVSDNSIDVAQMFMELSTARQLPIDFLNGFADSFHTTTRLDLVNSSGFNTAVAGVVDNSPQGGALVPLMTSNSAPSGTASASSSYGGGYEAYRAFDQSQANAWLSSAGSTGWLEYQFPSAKTVSHYSIRIDAENTRAPTAFTFEGYNGSTWDVLDTRSSISWVAGEIKFFALASNQTYTRFRVNVTNVGGGGYVKISEMQIYLGNCPQIPFMTSSSSPAGTVVTSAEQGGYEGWRAMDDDYASSYWSPNTGGVGTLEYNFGSSRTIGSFSLSSRSDVVNGMPKDFTFQYHNGSTWVTAATYTGELWVGTQTRTFVLGSSITASRFRINSTANVSGNLGVCGFQMYTPSVTVNMSLRSVGVDIDITPTTVDIYALIEETDAITLNTDLVAYGTRNNGTNWYSGTITSLGMVGSYRLIKATITPTASSDDIGWRFDTANGKRLKIHAVYCIGKA